MAQRRAARDLLVAGHVNVDRFLTVGTFPGPDRTVPVVAEREELGGTATNLARSARRAGVRVGLLARVGEGFPDRYRALLRRERIDLRGLTRVAGVPTPTCTIVEDRDGGTRTLIQQGPMGRAGALPGAWASGYRWLHLSTGDPGERLRLARVARRWGQRIALDPAQEIFYRWGARSLREIAPLAEILFGNTAEVARAAELLGAAGPAGLLRSIPLIVRTEGSRGATAFSRAETVHVAAPPTRRRHTLVGAGDAFRGGFYGPWFAGAPLARCLAAGHRSAAHWIEGAGERRAPSR
jgi:sugar/nucleoside kinase (ribokinase family)